MTDQDLKHLTVLELITFLQRQLETAKSSPTAWRLLNDRFWVENPEAPLMAVGDFLIYARFTSTVPIRKPFYPTKIPQAPGTRPPAQGEKQGD
jgi:hypothetical protein